MKESIPDEDEDEYYGDGWAWVPWKELQAAQLEVNKFYSRAMQQMMNVKIKPAGLGKYEDPAP